MLYALIATVFTSGVFFQVGLNLLGTATAIIAIVVAFVAFLRYLSPPNVG